MGIGDINIRLTNKPLNLADPTSNVATAGSSALTSQGKQVRLELDLSLPLINHRSAGVMSYSSASQCSVGSITSSQSTLPFQLWLSCSVCWCIVFPEENLKVSQLQHQWKDNPFTLNIWRKIDSVSQMNYCYVQWNATVSTTANVGSWSFKCVWKGTIRKYVCYSKRN